ncbi:hypothetical protein BRC81_07370 [Halobacteriales archaeon QS_1_68_20]|nr:MAG: hypothetical protein BRC81_07370 [Halobacteriales archaeon QS_1_68_20]
MSEGDPDHGTDRRADNERTVDPPNPARVVADADVLAADLLVGGVAREAMDLVRSHSWIEVVASDALVADAAAVIADLADPELAGDWRERFEGLRTPVEHPAGDHPALASAYRSNAAHLLTYDEGLTGVQAGAAINRRIPLSVRAPDAFVGVFDPERLYPEVQAGEYPGPDADPRD